MKIEEDLKKELKRTEEVSKKKTICGVPVDLYE